MKISIFNIEGMTCPSCSASVEKQIDELNGIKSRNVNHVTDDAKIEYDETVTSEEEIISMHEKIGASVKVLREKKGISQMEMALAIGIKSVAFYSNCENSKNNKHFNVEHIYKICHYLHISMSDFFQMLKD